MRAEAVSPRYWRELLYKFTSDLNSEAIKKSTRQIHTCVRGRVENIVKDVI